MCFSAIARTSRSPIGRGAELAGSAASTGAAAAATTIPGGTGAAPTTAAVAPPAGTRGGAVDGSVAKPRSETWSPRRIATLTGLAIIALAAAGYAYGKLRSAPPRHPDLAPRPPDLDGVDHLEPTS